VETLILSEREVEAMLDLDELLDGLADGFVQLSGGLVNAPDRNEIPMPRESFLLSMPGHRPGAPMTVKVVCVYEPNVALGLPSHLAVICLFDADTGACTAIMDGTYITAVRTAASAAVSARALSRPDSSVLTIIGAGVQGYSHLRTVPLTRPISEIRIASLHVEDAERLASLDPRAVAVTDVETAVRSSDIVALATHAASPVIDASWVAPGTHVSSVGYRPPRRELPVPLLDRASLFVETRAAAFEPTPVGCAELAGIDPASAGELGEVLAGTRPGRVDASDITVYKAMGHVIEDMVAAELAARAALDQGVGLSVELHAGRVTGVA
jgi:alanine dehydrogenase